MKKFLALPALILLTTPAFAEDSGFNIPGAFSGSVTLTSDYTSRGLAQSNDHEAIQGGLTYSIPLDEEFSVYAGAWASNVNFNDGGEANIEIDWAAGLGYTDGVFSLDTGVIYYQYPGADKSLNYEYYELQANVGYKIEPFFLRAAVNYAPDNAADSGNATYIKIAAEYQALDELKFTVRGGRQYIENNVNFGVPDYNDWGIGATYTFKEIDFTAEYVANNLDSASCGVNCDGKILFSVSKSF